MKIPRQVPQKHRSKILYWDEDVPGVIIITMEGWTVDAMSPTHVFGEDTVADVINTLDSATPCDCEWCTKSW